MDNHSSVLTEEQCRKVINNETSSKNFTINSYVVNSLSSQLNGHSGEQYFAKIQYQLNDEFHLKQYFVKILNGKSKLMFEFSKSTMAYEKEAFFYKTLLPMFQNLGIEANFMPKCYLCEPYTVVLEDLSLDDYRGTIKTEPLNLDHCQKCVETLAKFHVLSIVFESKKGKNYSLNDDYSKILEDKFYFASEENYATKFVKSSVKGLFELIELVPESSVTKKQFTSKLEEIVMEIMSAEDPVEFRKTLLHGDLWSNNFLFKYNQNNTIENCKLIDFQALKYGPPALDVLLFILTNTRKNFRDNHQKELLKHYYNYFSGLLIERNLQPSEILTESEFMKSCQVFMVPAKLQAIVDRTITFTSDETLLEVLETDESLERFIFEERGKYIVNSFQQNGQYKDLMLEDMLELRSMLFPET